MIVLNAHFDDLPMFLFADRFKNPSYLISNLAVRKDLSPVFGCPDEVVFQIVKTM